MKIKTSKAAALKHLQTPVVWENLSAAERRVWIAKDVIAAITAGKFKADTGYGLLLGLRGREPPDLRTAIGASRVCEGCAIASAFITLIARTNNCGFDRHSDDFVCLADHEYRPRLRAVFSPTQIAMLEAAYECSGFFACKENQRSDEPHIVAAVKFGRKFLDTTARMIAIWENVIANNGEFVP